MQSESTEMTFISVWRQTLAYLLRYYEERRGDLRAFFVSLFIFFMGLNMFCYWWALLSAYPGEFREEPVHYFLLQFPVGFLGAVFDSLSFFATIWIARRALRTISTRSYLCHLGIDLVIAVVATGWILMVFSVSGWLVSYIQFSPESLAERTSEYGGRLEAALRNPLRHWRNVYFGIIIGISAMLPTLTHIGLSMYSVTRFLRQRAQPIQETAI